MAVIRSLALVRWLVRGVASLAGVCIPAGAGLAADQPAEERATLEACRRQLLLIHDAVKSYYAAHARWPDRLSDLVGSTVAPELLVCPECERTRVFTPSNTGLFNILESDSQTVYKWELTTLHRAKGREETLQEWKLAQWKTPVKDAVPIVRCNQHKVKGEPVHLNLTFGGDVFISGVYWEEAYRDVLAVPYLETPGQVLVDGRPIPERVPPRPAAATTAQLDLGPVANALPGDPWQDGTSGDSMAELIAGVGASGLWNHGGTEFDVRALVQLDGRKLRAEDGEEAVGRTHSWFYLTTPVTIPVGRGGRRLHMLGGVVFPSPVGAEVGGLRVRYAGGTVQVVLWRYGIDLRDGWSGQEPGDEAGKLAWTAGGFTAEEDGVPKRAGPLKVYHWSVDLEKPGETIESVEFFSSATDPDPAKQHPSGPFVLGLTLE